MGRDLSVSVPPGMYGVRGEGSDDLGTFEGARVTTAVRLLASVPQAVAREGARAVAEEAEVEAEAEAEAEAERGEGRAEAEAVVVVVAEAERGGGITITCNR